jgi:Flp pilus assembly protein TadD
LVALAIGLLATAVVGVYFLRDSGRGKEYQAALDAIDRRDFRSASEHLDRHLERRPKDAEARLLAARSARRRGAFDDFQKHIAIYKEQKGSEKARALEYRLLRVQQGDLSDAELQLRAASAKPPDPDAYLTLEAVIEGSLLALQSRSGQSSRPPAGTTDRFVVLGRTAVDMWLGSRPSAADQVQGLVWRGRVRAAAGEFDGAIADFRGAVNRDPEHFDARYQLAITIGSTNHIEAALLLEQLREAQPENVDVLAGLATSYRLLGRPLAARAIYRDLIDRGMDDPRLLNELGLTELDAGRPAEAEQLFRRSLAKHPDDAVANLAMSRCMMLADKVDEARRFQERYESARAKAMSQASAVKP